MERTALFGMSLPELMERMGALGQKPYRARQVWDALYKQRVTSVEEMTCFRRSCGIGWLMRV